MPSRIPAHGPRRSWAAAVALCTVVLLPEASDARRPHSEPVSALGDRFAELAAEVGPTTVHIESRAGDGVSTGLEQLSRDYGFTLPQQRAAEKADGARSTGSGVVIDPSGLVLTNHHVVGGAQTVQVTLVDKRVFAATVLGSDPRTDVAVLQLQTRPEDLPLPAARPGDSDAIRVGEWVMAVGHPFDFQFSVSVGILSARGRRNLTHDEIQDYLQTDAAVNPGSSGGPLFDLNGELVGINTAIFNPGRMAQNAGIAFAIPSNMALRIARELQETGRVGRAVIGVRARTRPATPDNPRPGAEVMRVFADSPAEQAGLTRGDVVVAVDGEPVGSEEDLRSMVLARGADMVLRLQVERGTERIELQVETRAARNGSLPGMQLEADAHEWAGLVLVPPTAERMALLGVTPPEDERFKGLLVWSAAPASPGAVAGLVPGDILLAVSGSPVGDTGQLEVLVADKRTAPITFWRDGWMATAMVAGLERRSPPAEAAP